MSSFVAIPTGGYDVVLPRASAFRMWLEMFSSALKQPSLLARDGKLRGQFIGTFVPHRLIAVVATTLLSMEGAGTCFLEGLPLLRLGFCMHSDTK